VKLFQPPTRSGSIDPAPEIMAGPSARDEAAQIDVRDPAEPVPALTDDPTEDEPRTVAVDGPVTVHVVQALRVVEARPDAWATSRATVGREPVQIAGSDPNRRRLTITNTGPDAAWIGNSRENVRHVGMTLAGFERVTFEHTAEVYAVALGEGRADLDVATEYLTGVPAPIMQENDR